MRFDRSPFRNKLSRRMFILFIVCATIPIMVLALVAYARYTEQLKIRAFDLLGRSAKAQGMSIIERLLSVESGLKLIQLSLTSTASNLPPPVTEVAANSDSGNMLRWLAIYRQGNYTLLGGEDAGLLPRLKTLFASDPPSGDSRLRVLHGSGASPIICMIRPLAGDRPSDGYLIGVVNASFLWGDAQALLQKGLEFCIWNQNGMIRGAPGVEIPAIRGLSVDGNRAAPKTLTLNGQRFYASSWELFLKHYFKSPAWTLTALEPEDQVLAPVTLFNRYFLLMVGGILVVMLLLSSVMIRKSLVPVELLMEGVRKITQNRFDHRIQVASGDEFEELAGGFNRMSAQLEKQFKRLTLRSDLNRMLLSLLDTEEIITTVLDRMPDFFPCRTGAITIVSQKAARRCKTYMRAPTRGGEPVTKICRLSHTEERQLLNHNCGWFTVPSESSPFEYLRPLQAEGVDTFIVFPVRQHRHFFVLVSFGVHCSTTYDAEDLQQAGQLANQLATALTNANLIAELKDLNLGALHALARTVDAKSSWTAGHSVRVMRTCMDIGRAMGLSSEAMDNLRRAALLHDIGKIGIPILILNKKGALSPQEMALIQTHPDIGVRILSPIRAYEPLLPIIHQHHERYNGKGYPSGLAGDGIHELARILAVADTYDALVSDRPYRRGMRPGQAVEVIGRQAGVQLDPGVVEAFVRIMNHGKPREAVGEWA